MALPALPGAPLLEANRAAVLGHAKADPVLFVRAPELAKTDDARVSGYQRTIAGARYPWDTLGWLVPRFVHHPEEGRATLLREGYLYAEDPELAHALVERISLSHLFAAPKLYLQRGGVTRHLERTASGRYVYADGPEAGRTARLLLFDRVGVGQPPPELHRDLRGLRYRLHFERARILRVTDDRILAELEYDGRWIPSVLSSHGARLELVCESVPSDGAERLAAARRLGQRKARVLSSLRRAMIAQIEDGLPFDEPIREYGQQDGHLRYRWLVAYLSGLDRYRLNGVDYPVYGPRGQPKPPQVCIDFVYDTLERASGTWWQYADAGPRRTSGNIDFHTFSNTDLRRAESFLGLAKASSGAFEVYEVPERERVEMWRKQAFFAALVARADKLQPGDVVMIRGYTSFEKPWQRRALHYHSFYVYEVDPLTGMPIALVGNPGRPSIRPWLFEGLRTPKRSVWYSIRPKLEWLESIVRTDEHAVLESPPTLSAEPS